MLRGVPPLIFLCLVTASALAQAQAPEQSPGPDDDSFAPVPTEPVSIDGVELFRVRGVSSYPAAERASDIQDGVVAVAANPAIPETAVTLEERALGTVVVAAGNVLTTVVDADARLEGVERQTLAALHADSIKRAITRYRADREPRALALSAASAVAAAAAFLVLLFLLSWVHRRLSAVIASRIAAREDVGIQGFKVLKVERLLLGARGALGALHALLVLAATFFVLDFVLSQFAATRAAAATLLNLVLQPLATMGSGLANAIPDFAFLAILTIVVRYLLNLLRLFFLAVEKGSVQFSGFFPEWAPPTYSIVRALIIVFALVVAYPYIPGSGSEAFKGLSVFVGVIFSLGSTSFIANIIAGYVLTYRRIFRVGDRIRVGDVFGDVVQMRQQVTHIRTLKNEDATLPNSTILASNVLNYSALAQASGLILHTTVGIGYETPWRQVEAMLVMAAERTRDVAREPKPFVLQQALGDFAITYELNVYCFEAGQMMRIYTDLHRNILDVFNEYQVQIMTPAYVRDSEQPKIVPRERWYEPPAPSAKETPAQAGK